MRVPQTAISRCMQCLLATRTRTLHEYMPVQYCPVTVTLEKISKSTSCDELTSAGQKVKGLPIGAGTRSDISV
jgi:hypothetical protein